MDADNDGQVTLAELRVFVKEVLMVHPVSQSEAQYPHSREWTMTNDPCTTFGW